MLWHTAPLPQINVIKLSNFFKIYHTREHGGWDNDSSWAPWLDKTVQALWSLNRHIKIVHLMHAF